MKNKSIMFWVVLTLIVIGALPFLLSWYQISASRTAVIDQAQRNHLIISRATADRFATYMGKYLGVAESLAKNPDIYLAPDSTEATEAMKSSLVINQEIELMVLILNAADASIKEGNNNSISDNQVIQMARKNQSNQIDLEAIINDPSETIKLIDSVGKRLMLVRMSTARPQVDVLLAVKVDFVQWLNPKILGQSASISLVNATGDLIAHAGDPFEAVPDEWLALFESGMADGGANRLANNLDINQDSKFIAAFAQLDQVPWYVISRQSVAFAEQATAEMSSHAWRIFILVFVVVLGLLLLAYFSWVKPIRRIIKAQNALVGNSQTDADWHGGEVTALEKSFDALTRHINDRNALGHVFVDRYQVISPIGKGGMGSVFLGWDARLNRHVALKTLPIGGEYESRENMSQTLVQEAITAARISHRNVVSIYDVVSTKNTAFIAMEYIKGESLSSLLQRQKTLNLSLTLSIAIAVLKGLQTAHKMGFVHRDIKPANIMLDINGDIKITDFGTAALASGIGDEDVTGTHGYMAPETYLKGKIDYKCDLFAVGVVVFECLTGENPFKAKKANQTKFNVLNKSFEFPDSVKRPGSEKLFQALSLLLHKDPSKRPDSNTMTELITQTTPCSIKWLPEEAGIKIQYNEKNYENEETIVNHS